MGVEFCGCDEVGGSRNWGMRWGNDKGRRVYRNVVLGGREKGR